METNLAIWFLWPCLFVAPIYFSPKFFIASARIVLPIAYGMFAIGLFTIGYENISSSNFYNIANFGIAAKKQVSFQADDNFFNAITVLFSVCAAFLLWKGLTDFDKLKETLNEEAEKIWAIVFLTNYLREDEDTSAVNIQNISATDEICREFKGYIDLAIGNSTKADGSSSLDVLKHSDDVIDKCVSYTKKITVKPGDANDLIALEEIMKNLSELVSIRSQRRVCMQKSMPPFVLGALLVMSFSVLVPFFGNGASILSVNNVYVFLLSSTHMFIFMTLLDLSAPFDGYFSIQMDAFREASTRINRLLDGRKLG
jgi:hypothetical protein